MRIFNYYIAKRDFIPPLLIKILGKNVPHSQMYYCNESLKSYSQYNEDLIIDAILSCKESGFYVDVGANHPDQLSNTKRFYDRGWHGINIEPNPNLYELISRKRVRDINLNIGIGDSKSTIPFYVMTAHTLSSFDKKSALRSAKIHGAKVKEIIEINISTLSDVFHNYLHNNHIDFLSIDTEGYDMKVLTSNDWVLYRPTLIVIEKGDNNFAIVNYLIDKNYSLVFDNYTNLIFMDALCTPRT